MNLNRRSFLFGSAAAATLAGCATAKRGARELAPGEKRRVAVIGGGMQGYTLASQFLNSQLAKNCTVVEVCDCDRDRVNEFKKYVDGAYKNNACVAETDFRKIIADPMIDAVVIAAPDHWHAYMAVEAMKHGKDVYCEKPLTYSVEEAKKVMEAQKKYGRVFQTGSMQRSWREFRDACMIVRNGFIGDVLYVDANYGIGGKKLGGPSHPVRFFDNPENAEQEAVANPNVDWNMWLGPAKWRPYSSELSPRGRHKTFHMFWRFDDEFGTGYNGDWGAHHLDIAQWGLDLDHSGPYKVICSSEPHSKNPLHGGRRQFGMSFKIHKKYGDVTLYHGPFGVWGTVFYGTKGIVAVNRGKIAVWEGSGVAPTPAIRTQLQDVTFTGMKLVAASVGKDYGTDATVKKDDRLSRTLDTLEKKYDLANAKVQLYKSPNQVQNFCECIETRKCTISPSEVGGRGAILCQLCNMSYVYDTGFDWDGEKMEFANGTGDPSWLKRDYYRNGWDVVV